MAALKLDAQGALQSSGGGTSSQLNITAATLVKATPGRLVKIEVTTAGSAAGAAYDAATTSGNVAANLIAPLPDTVGGIVLDWPCQNGILIVPGTGQVLSVSYF
jgi:hypothetical protein